MSPKNPEFPEGEIDVKAIKTALEGREPTPEELAAEEDLLAEDLAALEKELAAAGVKTAPGISEKPKVKRVSAPPAAPRIARAKKQKCPARHPEERNSGNLSLSQIFSKAKGELLGEGVIPVGVFDKGRTSVPISNRDVASKIMGMQKPDLLGLVKILLTWRPETAFTGQQVKSILKLLEEGRRASIPHILAAIIEHPTDYHRGETVGSVSGAVRRQIHVGFDDWIDGDIGIDNGD